MTTTLFLEAQGRGKMGAKGFSIRLWPTLRLKHAGPMMCDRQPRRQPGVSCSRMVMRSPAFHDCVPAMQDTNSLPPQITTGMKAAAFAHGQVLPTSTFTPAANPMTKMASITP
jgi:hypothetical protein